jgi:hypothetical protein
MTATTLEPQAPPADPPHWDDLDEQRGSFATLWSDSMVYAARNIAHIRQIPEKLLDVTVQPLMFVLLFAYVFGGAIGVSDGNYREYILGGILIQTLAFGLVGQATSIATDGGNDGNHSGGTNAVKGDKTVDQALKDMQAATGLTVNAIHITLNAFPLINGLLNLGLLFTSNPFEQAEDAVLLFLLEDVAPLPKSRANAVEGCIHAQHVWPR